MEGYEGLKKALTTMSMEEVIAEVKKSGLRGRGGAGFPTGLKWEFTYKAPGTKKYVVCNADEGDPGAFMDRSILEGDPHALIEGMALAAYAIGADEGYIYVRAEYPLATKRLRTAISQAEEKGFLGENILGSGFNFNLRIKEGAGAFVCGEETALLMSIEGNRGMPRVRPPFPATKGLWGKPTNINNVETYANIPVILRKGADWYAGIGTEKSKGTKVFALTGKVRNTGLAEVPMGITMREIIFEIGEGIQNDKEFKAVQIGGPSGGCLPPELLDLPVDYDSLVQAGAMMGSGGLVIMDEETCMVDVAKFFLNFTQSESCGKCTPCREGTKRMLEILTRITEGQGKMEDIDLLERLGKVIKSTALCGLGQTAPNPVLTTLQYFRDEYEAHIKDKKCPAGACEALIKYEIIPEKCTGCTRCARSCPANAITGKVKEVHVIDQDKCIKCGICYEKCRFDAIFKG
jgi:NADH-quinone oxidoreductase subunit F